MENSTKDNSEIVYSFFAADFSDDEILNQIFEGKLAVYCAYCKCGNTVPPEPPLWTCKVCNTEQYVPTLNPAELNKPRK